MPAASGRIFWSGLVRPETPERIEFQQGGVLTVELPCEAFDASIANVFHHFDESTHRSLVLRAACALRPGRIRIGPDAVRAESEEDAGPGDSLLDLYSRADNGTGLWSIEQLRSWRKAAEALRSYLR